MNYIFIIFLYQGNDCTFENGFCGWSNAPIGNADFNWTIGSGSTSSAGKSPSKNRYGSTTGEIMLCTCSFIE